MSNRKSIAKLVSEYSLALIAGVIVALAAANYDLDWYERIIKGAWSETKLFGTHVLNLRWFVNEVFMVFFFGVAMKEITDAVLPGGTMSSLGKALNPLIGTIGGIVGPVMVYICLAQVLYTDPEIQGKVLGGWAVPTATDIALAWLAARMVFGAGHSAVSFLLLLAIADDAIGLIIIAVFYPDPTHPFVATGLLYVMGGVAVAWGLRRWAVQNWIPYVLLGGGLSWYGLVTAHLHPALALVPVIPLLPKRLSTEETSAPSPLDDFEHSVKHPVDWGLFLFAFANAGVSFERVGTLTWIVLASLLIGKMLGVTLFSWVALKMGSPLPSGMSLSHLITAGLVAGLGLTVALFFCGVAFPAGSDLVGEAKMGALFSTSVFGLSLLLGRALGIRPVKDGAA
ncbi:MAG: Na+/H+ antiporter NhaA [Planctomycetota bacterium]|nr:Na+/H+ antiporter NhaA [Planctomycetota bacterium]